MGNRAYLTAGLVLIVAVMMISLPGFASDLPSKYVLLNRSAELTDYVGRYTEAMSGKTFLVIEMTLENHGYDTLEINPNYFGVVIDKVVYPYDKATFSTDSPLTSLTLLDGGATSGYLVFQIPEGKTKYELFYGGPEDAEVIYGDLVRPQAAQAESDSNRQFREVSFSLDKKDYTFTGEDYWNRGSVDTSNPGYIIQKIRSERVKDKGEISPFVEVIIKTIIDDSLKPANRDRAIQDANDKYIGDIRKKYPSNIDEEPTYEATLANGNTVVVHEIEKMPSTYSNNLFWCSYMLDDVTIVTVASSENNRQFNEVLQTIEIGEMQDV